MAAGVPKEVPSTTINMVCGSGLRAVAMGYQAIRCGDASVMVAGGQESMSQVSWLAEASIETCEAHHYFCMIRYYTAGNFCQEKFFTNFATCSHWLGKNFLLYGT